VNDLLRVPAEDEPVDGLGDDRTDGDAPQDRDVGTLVAFVAAPPRAAGREACAREGDGHKGPRGRVDEEDLPAVEDELGLRLVGAGGSDEQDRDDEPGDGSHGRRPSNRLAIRQVHEIA